MRRNLLLTFSLLATIQAPCFGQHITVRQGDTLSGLASKYNVSVRSIMEKNEIFNADTLQVGQTLKLPENAMLSISSNNKFHTVKLGDNLSKISKHYNVDENSIIALNGLSNPNVLYLGQKIILPTESKIIKSNSVQNSPDFHIVQKGETLSIISKTYKIPIQKLVSINNIIDPRVIKPSEKIYLKEGLGYESDMHHKETNEKSIVIVDKSNPLTIDKGNTQDWRKYGSLKVNWSSWKTLNGSLVTPAINNEGKPLFIAVSCTTTRINRTGKDNQWKDWITPSSNFEFNLIDDLCKLKAN